jgi:hypothetical membrane protein
MKEKALEKLFAFFARFRPCVVSATLTELFASLAILSFLITIILAIILYQNYSFFGQNFSDLGVGATAGIFNYGIILTSLLLIIYFYFKFSKQKLQLFLSIISAIGLLGVGLFPLTLPLFHYIFAGLFFLFSFLLILFKTFSIKKKKYFFYYSIISLLIIFFYALTLFPALQKLTVFAIVIWHLFYLISD